MRSLAFLWQYEKRYLWIRIAQHLLFWALSFFVIIRFSAKSSELSFIDYLYTGIFHISILIAVYVNLYILIPRFVRKEKYLWYIPAVLLLMAAATQFNIWTFDKGIDLLFPNTYFFISYYYFGELYPVMLAYVAITSLLKLSKGWFAYIAVEQRLSLLEKEKTEAELAALKTQIHPHFLFNSLQSVYSLSLKQDKRTPEVVIKLADLMRYFLYETQQDRVPLEKEIQNLENYLSLQRLRVGGQARIDFEQLGKADGYTVAPLLLLPFVENSFKHGIKGTTGEAYIDIKMRIDNSRLLFEVKNNKGQVDQVPLDYDGGVGLNNVKQRLELQYPDQHHLNIEDQEDYFRIELSIPLSI